MWSGELPVEVLVERAPSWSSKRDAREPQRRGEREPADEADGDAGESP